MSRPLKKTDKGNRSITDFFSSRSSMGTPSSSQPASSQPSMSQATSTKKSGLKPATKQATKKSTSSTYEKNIIISVSSGSGDDSVFVSGTSRRTRVSMPNATTDSGVVPSGPSKTKAATTARAAAAAKPTNTRQAQSSAKTIVRRRPRPAAETEAGSSTSKPPTRRKRKLDLTDSSDEEMFKPDPNAMNAALTRAPVPRVVSAPPKSTPGKTRADVPSSPSTRSTSSKRRRLSIHDSRGVCHGSGEDSDVVPSSVSDEHELVLPKSPQANVKAVKKNVGRWRLDTSPDFPERDRSPPPSDYPSTPPVSSSPGHETTPLPKGQAADETDLDVDMEDAADTLNKHNTLRCSRSEAEVKQQLLLQESNSSLASIPPRLQASAYQASGSLAACDSPFRTCTPPPIEVEEPLPQLPPTPVALDAETKTRQWIEKVKADALEAARRAQQESSDDEFELRSVSDSDEELPSTLSALLARPGIGSNQKGAESYPLSSLPSSPAPDDLQREAGPSTRYSLRRRDPVQNAKRRSSSSDGVENPLACPPPRKRVANPLEKLLREKKTREKFGKGIEDIRRAEAVLQEELLARNKDRLLEEMAREEEDSDDDAMWADEEAAMNVARQHSRHENAFSLNAAFEVDDSDSDEPVELDITEATKHLGDEQGEAIGKILNTDRKGWLSKGRSKKRLAKGIPLWDSIDQDSESVMEEDTEESLHLPFSEEQIAGDQVLSLLNTAVVTGDLVWLSSLLATQLLSQCGEAYMHGLVDWLFKLSLSEDEELSDQAYLCLVALATRLSVRCNLSTPFVHCLRKLGARSSLIETCGLPPYEGVRRRQVPPDVIANCVTRILEVVKAFSRHNVVAHEDIPNMILALLLIGFDSTSSAELRSEIMVIIDVLGSTVPASSTGYSDMEPILCKRLLRFSSELTPVNKAFLVSFFCGGCPLMARVARWISHGLLLGAHILDEQPYTSLPALEPIADLVSPPGGSKAMFDVVSGAEEDNYFDDLLCYVQILNRAFNDVPAYVQEEKRLAAANSQPVTTGTAPASPEKPKTELQRIKHSLDVLHGKIVDTRAAHLDRSRVKAALQQLSFRIYYTREAALKWYRAPRPANLRGYFRKPTA